MNTLKIGGVFFLLILAGILMMGCRDGETPDTPEENPDTSITVAFTGLTADGSVTAATTKLTLTFDKDITGLATTDITFTAGITGASKGSLTKAGTGVYELVVSGVTASGNVTVAVAKTGFTITGSPRSVTVYPAPPVEPPVGTPVTTWKGLTAPTATKALQYASYQGKNDVLHVSPSGAEYAWSVLEYSLNAYANKEITITLGMDVWLETAGKVVWQVNQNGYPVIAGSTATTLSSGQWLTVTGTATITVDGTGKVVYLSKDQLGGNTKLYITNFVMTIVEGSGPPPSGKTLTLTVGAKENLTSRITNFTPSGRTLTWSSSSNSVATVANNGIVTAVGFTTGGSSTDSSAATGTATITVTASGAAPNTDSFTINTTMASQVDMMTLPSLKDQFASHFLIGNIATQSDYSNGTVTNQRLNRHYNVLTAENHMKPDSFFPSWQQGVGYDPVTGVITYYWTNADNFVNAATNSNFKILAHVLLWHQQIPQWQKDLGNPAKKTEALSAMKKFITDVVTRYKGKIWAWDVLNEIFPDGVSATADWKNVMRTTGDGQAANPWYVAIGSDFVYEGYLAARLADPNATLYYNDYNLDTVGKSTMVHDMVRDVNAKYAAAYPSANRKLIEGIGMQSHHNTTVTANAIRTTLNRFKPLGVKISISEIDVLSQPYNGGYSPDRLPPTNDGKLSAASLYHEYFKLFLEFADIIERVTFWGVNDEQSWRRTGLPLIFDGSTTSRAKPAYYKVVGALE